MEMRHVSSAEGPQACWRCQLWLLAARSKPWGQRGACGLVTGTSRHGLGSRRRWDERARPAVAQLGVWMGLGRDLQEMSWGGAAVLWCCAQDAGAHPDFRCVYEQTKAFSPFFSFFSTMIETTLCIDWGLCSELLVGFVEKLCAVWVYEIQKLVWDSNSDLTGFL